MEQLTEEEIEKGLFAKHLQKNEDGVISPTNYGRACALIDTVNRKLQQLAEEGRYPEKDEMKIILRELAMSNSRMINYCKAFYE